MENFNGSLSGDNDDFRLLEQNRIHRDRTNDVIAAGKENLEQHMKGLCQQLGLSPEEILVIFEKDGKSITQGEKENELE